MATEGPRYVLTSGLEPVRSPKGLIFRGDGLSVRLEGASVERFAETLLPLLTAPRSLSELAASLPDVDPAELQANLDGMVAAGILRRREPGQPGDATPLLAFAERLGVPAEAGANALARSRVGVVGLEAHGAILAMTLAAAGIGTLVLADPYPCPEQAPAFVPGLSPASIGRPLHDVLAAALANAAPDTTVRVVGEGSLRRADVARLTEACDVVVGCFDRGMIAAHHWLNREALARGIPALYAALEGHEALIGPMVIPGETACFMCSRMRHLACEASFEDAMLYEEHLDRLRQPKLHRRAVLPPLAANAASVLALEILKRLLGIGPAALVGRLRVFDALTLATSLHPIAEHPECPVCGTKPVRSTGPLDDSRPGTEPKLTAEQMRAALVSPRCGIVMHCDPLASTADDPNLPAVYEAVLSNHQLASAPPLAMRVSLGRGLATADAMAGALGEAVEHYSASFWHPDEIVYARRGDLDGAALDPRELVLYAPDQYPGLPFLPYADGAPIGWMQGFALAAERAIHVPALAVPLTYRPGSPAEMLFGGNSSGLATAPDLAEAVRRGALEVMERDAFMIAWLNRLPCPEAALGDHPAHGVAEIQALLARRGVALRAFQVPTDLPCHVFIAVTLSPADVLPAATIGLGAGATPAEAARKAVLEVAQIRRSFARALTDPAQRARAAELAATGAPRTVPDHGLLYADRAMLPALGFLLDQTSRRIDWTSDTPSPARQLSQLVSALSRRGTDLIYVDLTPADMRRRRLFTARVLIPGLQPIDFGIGARRLGGERVLTVPASLGFAPPASRPALNSDPHPMA